MKGSGTSAPEGKRKGRFPALFQVFLAAGLLALIYLSFGQNVLFSQKSGIPSKLEGLELVSNVKGDEALAQISRLHGGDIALTEANILRYTHKNPYHNENSAVTVWIGKAQSPTAASQLLQSMTDGITKGNSGFGNLQKISIDVQELLKVDGPGGNHYFYIPRHAPDKVVWLAIQNADDTKILETAVKVF